MNEKNNNGLELVIGVNFHGQEKLRRIFYRFIYLGEDDDYITQYLTFSRIIRNEIENDKFFDPYYLITEINNCWSLEQVISTEDEEAEHGTLVNHDRYMINTLNIEWCYINLW